MAKEKDELIALVEELMMECDERHAHEEILMEQVRELGGEPVPFSKSSPWHIGLESYMSAEE